MPPPPQNFWARTAPGSRDWKWAQVSLRHATLKPSPLCKATRPNRFCFLVTALDDSSSYRVQRFNTTPSWRLLAGSLCISVSKCWRASFRRPRYSEHTARLFTAWHRQHTQWFHVTINKVNTWLILQHLNFRLQDVLRECYAENFCAYHIPASLLLKV